jgi:tRNA modification GTPase
VGRLPEPRRASVAELRHPQTGKVLDQGLVVRFPGPGSATGEDLAELHVHGGRSVVAAILHALSWIEGLRAAEPGEFTRRAFENGRIDLSEAEGLADLLLAETEAQRRASLALFGGALRQKVEQWQQRMLRVNADIEASLDFADEGDVASVHQAAWGGHLAALRRELDVFLAAPVIERLRDGVRVVIAGPPNAGKSTLLNALAGRDAAITSEIAGTTRDAVEAPTSIGGAPFLLIDTAGLRESADAIEAIGVERARQNMEAADIILWLGDAADVPDDARTLIVQPKIDIADLDASADVFVSAKTGAGLDQLIALLGERSRSLLPQEGQLAVNARHRALLEECCKFVDEAAAAPDSLIASEALRQARGSLDRVTGRAGVEQMLDALFGQFCIGK